MARPPVLHQPVSGFLQRQPSFEKLGVLLGEADRVWISEKVRRMQQVDVQGVTVNPFPAVQHPPQLHQWGIHRHTACVLDRVAGTDLIRDRADAADPRGDVGRLGVGASPQERFEEPRRLVDVQLDAVHGAVGQRDVQSPPLRRGASAPTVSVRISGFTDRSARR